MAKAPGGDIDLREQQFISRVAADVRAFAGSDPQRNADAARLLAAIALAFEMRPLWTAALFDSLDEMCAALGVGDATKKAIRADMELTAPREVTETQH